MAGTQPRIVRFGPFVADVQTGELRKDGVKLRLSGQPFQVLAFLLERPGEVVTRDELQKRLWPDTFVDVDHNLNTAVNKIREVLGDSAESPRFVETLPRRGYRFIAPLPDFDTDVLPPGQRTEPLAKPPFKSKGPRWVYAGVAMLGVAALVAILWRSAFPAKSLPRVVGFRQLTQDGQGKGWMTTDGSRIYFNEVTPGGTGYQGPFQVAVGGGEVTPFPVLLKQPILLDLSTDATEFLLKSASDSSLWLQPVAGGSPKPLNGSVGYAGFGPGSKSILYGTDHNVYLISRDGQTSHKLFSLEDDAFPFYFRMSPDGKTFRFSNVNQRNGTNEILEASTDGTRPHAVLSGSGGEWTGNGRYFVFNSQVRGQLAVQPWSRRKGFWWQQAEEPTRLTTGPLEFQHPLPARDGKEIYAVGTMHRAEVMRYDSRNGEFVPFLAGISAQGVAFSRDGQWVTYSAYPDGSLWRCKVDGSERLQLTFPPTRAWLPSWSPDGSQIAYSARVPGQNLNIYLVPRDGGIPHRILPSEESQVDANWSPDGKLLVFASQQVSRAPISMFDLRAKAVSIVPGSMGLFSPHWSPDGRYIVADHTSGPGTMLFDLSTQRWTRFTDGDMDNATWSHDGTSLYFESGDGSDRRILRISLKDRKIALVAALKGVHRPADEDYFWGWAGLSPDDSPVIARNISTQEIYALQIEWP